MTETATVHPARMREVLGNYPTGVSVITAIDEDGAPAGMAVGTFTSVSLDPPLIAFLPDKGSSSFPRIRTAKSFCVNVLGAEQQNICRAFARRGGDKFDGVCWQPAPSGAPRLDGAAAWIDCDFDSVTDAGDHYLVMGRVRELDGVADALPLVFFQGGYGRFSPSSLVTFSDPDVTEHLRNADLARADMERVAGEVGAECVAVTAVTDQLVVVAGAGNPAQGIPRTRVGQRSPFLPPLGALFVSEAPESARQAWLDRAGGELTERERTEALAILDTVHHRGWSLSLVEDAHFDLEQALQQYTDGDRSPEHLQRIRKLANAALGCFEPSAIDPAGSYRVRLLSAPVTDQDGAVVLLLTLWGLPRPLTGEQIDWYTGRLREAADAVSAKVRAAA
jgi:flavin reductase (DIM6/NTAB) family NADH-FMN oxidoreductase RutF